MIIKRLLFILLALLLTAPVYAETFTIADDNYSKKFSEGDGTDIYNIYGDNALIINSQRGFAQVNITGAGSRVVDNCSDDGCPTQYFNGQFSDTFSGADGTTLAQHYPPWYGVRWPSTASNCVITGGKVVCTPVLGSNLITNGNFSAWSGDNPSNYTVAPAETGSVYVTQVDLGGGNYAARFVCDATNFGVFQTTGKPIGTWILAKVDIKSVTSGGVSNFKIDTGNAPYTISSAGKYSILMKSTNLVYQFVGTTIDNSDYVADDHEAYEVIWSTFLSNLVDYKFKKEVVYSIDMTVADGDIAGIAFKAADLTAGAEDFCAVYLNKGTGKVELMKVVAGAVTTPVSGAVTYVAGATLLVRTDATDTDGTKWEVLYNGTQVGTDQTLNEASLNSNVAGFFATSVGTTFDNWKAGKNI